MEKHENHSQKNSLVTSAHATLHCLSGCVIGEVIGLAIGVSFGLGVWPTILLATTLAYISGFTLGLIPVMRNNDKTMIEAFQIIWLSEVVSIGVMEVAMNAADYAMGGMHTGTVFSSVFWIAMLVAVIAGFLAAWPINWWLLSRNLKKCH